MFLSYYFKAAPDHLSISCYQISPDDIHPAISTSDSSESVGTVGTFGPRRRDKKRPVQLVITTAPSSRNSVYCTPPASPARTASTDNDACSVSERSLASFHTALSVLEPRTSLFFVGEAQDIKVNDEAGSAVLNSHPSHLTFGPRSPFYAQFPASASTHSISSCPPSPYSYTSPKPCQEDDARSLKAYPSSESLASYTSVPRTPSSLHSSSSQLSLTRQPRVRRTSNYRDSIKSELPKSLSWLRDVNIGLLIDQEGFRAVHPSFRFVGYSPHTRSLDPQGGVIEGGVAEFMPVKRQAFNFHYALFDGLPILRRVTVNGEEDRDYISRQATLSLKSNGVYTIRGSETSSLHTNYHDDAPGAQKLRWKFDYMVDVRRQGEGSGRVLDGEKTLTPLTFSCSPLLLDPSQGKKIRLMHIVKKSVVTKLVAEKVEPTPSGRISAPSSPTISSSPNIGSPKTHPGISRVWNVHRRAQSQVTRNVESSEGLLHIPRSSRHVTSKTDGQIQGNEENHRDTGRIMQRRRRASSAGEKRRHADPSYIQFGPLTNVPLERDISRLSSPVVKHNRAQSKLGASLSLRVRAKLN
ncbi:hypothetical protein IW261DRAFT_1607003 [Armillaria novae-zelandiae]|uniref:Uncharacterized protein n=1 Tax=Armillaria novae-zelandiae TaxID=153914 RepID=A0AA39UA46_9AGAR|nr:hypothetical protein IW261DRAFT_1607003 [Armillaria novae-zelandiae]